MSAVAKERERVNNARVCGYYPVTQKASWQINLRQSQGGKDICMGRVAEEAPKFKIRMGIFRAESRFRYLVTSKRGVQKIEDSRRLPQSELLNIRRD
ncbi:hypothetical protein ACJ73_05421 [Blastomyces percursus]|uniref:Uncharacterized protein n=1 Tax=Blastomyces percursus TaxID=1658174 RepID=A0A1J9Q3U4_9EURO|nr:hypothetical protein ACJ73_05421 [Blastomyces percursus]